MTAPVISIFLWMRRAIRQDQAVMDALWDDIRYLRRHAKLLDQASPFNASRAATLRDEADLIQADYDLVRDDCRRLGAALMAGAWEVDEATTFDERCEILNINVADRAQLPADCGLVHMFSAYGLEDSAQRRRMAWKSGPLYSAVQIEIYRVLLETEAGRAASQELWEKATGPGGMFEDLPLYDQQPDGTMKRRPPKLRVVSTTPTTESGAGS